MDMLSAVVKRVVKEAMSDYQEFVQEGLKDGKSIPEIAKEWKNKK